MPQWPKLVILTIVSIIGLFLLTIGIWYFVILKSGQIVVFNTRSDFKLQVDPKTLKSSSDSACFRRIYATDRARVASSGIASATEPVALLNYP